MTRTLFGQTTAFRTNIPRLPSRIDTDADLAACIAAGITYRTFQQLAPDVADTFAPGRRVRSDPPLVAAQPDLVCTTRYLPA